MKKKAHRTVEDEVQEKIDEAKHLIKELVELISIIEPQIWIAAFWSILIASYSRSGCTVKQFREESLACFLHYADVFQEESEIED